MLGESVTEFVHGVLDQQWLDAAYRLFGEVWVPWCTPHAMLVVVEGIERRIIDLSEHAHLKATFIKFDNSNTSPLLIRTDQAHLSVLPLLPLTYNSS